jgi:SagB-type dehydrogenase family enzyme
MPPSPHPVARAYHQATSLERTSRYEPGEKPADRRAGKAYPGAPRLALPRPARLDVTLGEAIRRRGSCRAFAPGAMRLGDLSTILANAYGYNASRGGRRRRVPSAGGLYPLELYVISVCVEGAEAGILHFDPSRHSLEVVRADAAVGPLLPRLFLEQEYLADAAALLMITGVFQRSLWKYRDRGYRYLLLEAGHVAQNVGLVATALGLGSVNLGGFLDEEVSRSTEWRWARPASPSHLQPLYTTT